MAATFELYKSDNGEYRFRLKTSDGQKILASESYKSEGGAENGIESVRKNASDDKRYEKRESSSNKYYFVLKAGNGEVIGTSGMYDTNSDRDGGIEAVKRDAPGAPVES